MFEKNCTLVNKKCFEDVQGKYDENSNVQMTPTLMTHP